MLKSYMLATSAFILLSNAVSYAQGNTNITDQPQQLTTGPDKVKSDWQPSLINDGAYDRVTHVNRILPWQYLREADVMWKKRVWREIDVRQKQNMAFRYPGDENTGGGMFIEILLDAIKKGKIKAYSTTYDRFTSALTKDQVMEMLIGKADTIQVEDPITGAITTKIIRKDFNPDQVTKFRIKEDNIFDRNLGRMVTRIIGLAPLLDRYDDDGQFRASSPMFWISYEELRPILAQYEVFNPDNDVARMTWDEYFENRFFASYIIKVSNPFDQSFTNMGLQGTDALYEGQRVNEMLFNKEHDMWVY